MRIALVIPGRFWGFDLARALLARGHRVTVLTTYPRMATRRFGLPDDAVWSAAGHEAIRRLTARVPGLRQSVHAEALASRAFGRWAERALVREPWDVIHGWSGVSEEHLTSGRVRRQLTLLARGSSHIDEQSRLLADEEVRAGVPIDRPSRWMRERETREYAAADAIGVLSSFARESFIRCGVPPERVAIIPPGVDTTAFAASAAMREARRRRILSGAPLRLLYVGALSYRKGLLDLAAAITRLDPARFELRVVGPALPEAAGILAGLEHRVTRVGKVPEPALPAQYAEADVFVFPTIEDGFAVVLNQAMAAGLPIVTTPNSAGPDLIREGEDGWIVPIRDPEALASRLAGLDATREALAGAADRAGRSDRLLDWTAAAARFEAACSARMPASMEHAR